MPQKYHLDKSLVSTSNGKKKKKKFKFAFHIYFLNVGLDISSDIKSVLLSKASLY